MAHIEVKSDKVREMAEKVLSRIEKTRERKSAPFIEDMIRRSQIASERNKTFWGRLVSFLKGEYGMRATMSREEAHVALLDTPDFVSSLDYRRAAYCHGEQEELCLCLIKASKLSDTVFLTERDVDSLS